MLDSIRQRQIREVLDYDTNINKVVFDMDKKQAGLFSENVLPTFSMLNVETLVKQHQYLSGLVRQEALRASAPEGQKRRETVCAIGNRAKQNRRSTAGLQRGNTLRNGSEDHAPNPIGGGAGGYGEKVNGAYNSTSNRAEPARRAGHAVRRTPSATLSPPLRGKLRLLRFDQGTADERKPQRDNRG